MHKWLRLILFSLALTLLLLSAAGVSAEKLWNWHYTGSKISASGTFSTTETADEQGYYQILTIEGHRNGERIIGLHPTGKSIPGNEPFTLDNLVRVDANGQITPSGFGFATVSGNYINTFYASFLSTPVYMEVFVTPTTYSELPVTFTATPITEPEIKLDTPADELEKMGD